MDLVLIFKSILLGIVQGLTEFLPISSTGHMIIVDEYLKLPDNFREMFLVVVQLGSILSVVVYFWNTLLPKAALHDVAVRNRMFLLWMKVLAGVFPALLIGGLFGSAIKRHLYSVQCVAIALFIGGIVLIVMERRKRQAKVTDTVAMSWPCAIGIGLAQCVAMIPGVSRSAATIIGALCLGASRQVAVEYSFFLAIPTMVAASAYSVMKEGTALTAAQWIATAAGFVTAFVVSWAVIAFLMSYIRRKDFQLFGWYRIALSVILLIWLYFIK